MTMFWKTIRDAFPAGEPGHVLTRIPFWVPLIVQFWTVIPITSSSSGATLHIGDSNIDTPGSNRYAIISNSDCRGINCYVHGATDVDSVSVGAIPGRRNGLHCSPAIYFGHSIFSTEINLVQVLKLNPVGIVECREASWSY